jgi:hypothetical protein
MRKIIAGAGLPIGTLDVADAFIFPGAAFTQIPRSTSLAPIPFVNGVATLIFCVGISVALIALRYIPQQFP